MGADVVNGNSGGTTVVELAADADAVKAKYSAEQLRTMLGRGQAIRNENGDPSYPIADKEDLSNAIRAVGRGGGSHDRIRAYIIRRAKALGASNMIPDNWSSGGGNKGGGSGSSGSGSSGKKPAMSGSKAVEPDEGVTTPDGGDNGGDNGDEPDAGSSKTTDADTAADNEAAWAALQKHADELGLGVKFVDTLDTTPTQEDTVLEQTTGTDTDKAAVAEENNTDGDALVKALSAALEKKDNPLRKNFEAIVESSTKTIAETVREQGERLVKVENMAVPGGPALRRTEVERAQSRKADLEGEVVRYKALAAATDDPILRKGYAGKASQLEAEIRSL